VQQHPLKRPPHESAERGDDRDELGPRGVNAPTVKEDETNKDKWAIVPSASRNVSSGFATGSNENKISEWLARPRLAVRLKVESWESLRKQTGQPFAASSWLGVGAHDKQVTRARASLP
jgi:hypothetical protein